MYRESPSHRTAGHKLGPGSSNRQLKEEASTSSETEVDGDRKGGVDSGVCDRLSSSPQAAEGDKAWVFSQSL